MEVLTLIQGSPRKNGNTESACRYLKERLSDAFTIDYINLHELNIKRCAGCRRCMEDGICAIRDDDFPGIWEKIKEADVIVQTCPVYWYSPPGIMKDFIDRTHSTYVFHGYFKRNCRAFNVTIAAWEGFETCEKIMSSWVENYGADVIESIRIVACEKGDLAAKSENMNKLDQLISSIRSPEQ